MNRAPNGRSVVSMKVFKAPASEERVEFKDNTLLIVDSKFVMIEPGCYC